MEHEIWYAISPNYETINVSNPKSYNLPVYCWLRMVKIGSNTTSYGNTYEIFNYEFFDTQLQKFTIEFGGWRLLQLIDPTAKNAFSSTYCKISDKYGSIQNFSRFPYLTAFDPFGWNDITFHIPNNLEKLINYIKHEFIKFDNLLQYNQHVEIVGLKRKVISLTSEKERLEKENAALKNSLSRLLGAKNANQLTKSDMEIDRNILVQLLTRYIQDLNAILTSMTESDINI